MKTLILSVLMAAFFATSANAATVNPTPTISQINAAKCGSLGWFMIESYNKGLGEVSESDFDAAYKLFTRSMAKSSNKKLSMSLTVKFAIDLFDQKPESDNRNFLMINYLEACKSVGVRAD